MHRLASLMLWVFVFTIPWQNSLSLEAVGTVSQLVGIVAFLIAITPLCVVRTSYGDRLERCSLSELSGCTRFCQPVGAWIPIPRS